MGEGVLWWDARANHGMGHGVSGGVGIKAAVELVALIDERDQPTWVGPGAGRWGWRAKQLTASMADSQRMIVCRGTAGTEKKPRFFWEPGAMPRQERSSAKFGADRGVARSGYFSFQGVGVSGFPRSGEKKRGDYAGEVSTSFQSCCEGRRRFMVGCRAIMAWALESPVGSASKPQ
jgi:hypothetical protein